jgi:glycosyltransferase involved in cell wall biosynthesis
MVENRVPKKRVIYIPNGVDKPRDFHSKKEFSLITISRLVSWKNIDVVIEAANILKARLIIVGDGPERNHLETFARERNVQAEFVGNLTSTQVLYYMERAKYFLQMSDYEGVSFSLLESMSCGLVPIVSGNDGNRIVVINDHNGVISRIEGASIAKAIRSVENQKGKYEELSRKAIATVSFSFDGKMKREQMLNLLSDIIK